MSSFDWDWRSTEMRQSSPGNLWKIRKSIADVQKLIGEGDTVLDVGCGQGHFFKILFPKKEGLYTGIDRDAGEIAVAKEGWGGDFKVMDLYDLEGQWDIVVCSRVLIHLPDFEGTMKVLLGCARKYCVLIVAMGDDRADNEGKAYFRTFSGKTLESVGKCEIKKYSTYATVIYDRRQK